MYRVLTGETFRNGAPAPRLLGARPKKLTRELRDKAARLRRKGLAGVAIARRLGVSAPTVSRALLEWDLLMAHRLQKGLLVSGDYGALMQAYKMPRDEVDRLLPLASTELPKRLKKELENE